MSGSPVVGHTYAISSHPHDPTCQGPGNKTPPGHMYILVCPLETADGVVYAHRVSALGLDACQVTTSAYGNTGTQ